MQNPRAFGYFTLLAAGVAGMVLMGLIMFIFRRQLFSRSVARSLKAKNDAMRNQMIRITTDNRELEDENARLRANWGQAVIKATQGVAVVLSAFGVDSAGGTHDEDTGQLK